MLGEWASPSILPAQKNLQIYRLQTTHTSMPQVSHIILLHFTQQLWSSCCKKPLPWLFPCSPSLCAARTKAGQKGTRKGSCIRIWESKKTRVGVMGQKRKGEREPVQLVCLSQHQDSSPLQRNSFFAALIVTSTHCLQLWRKIPASSEGESTPQGVGQP